MELNMSTNFGKPGDTDTEMTISTGMEWNQIVKEYYLKHQKDMDATILLLMPFVYILAANYTSKIRSMEQCFANAIVAGIVVGKTNNICTNDEIAEFVI